MAQFCECGSLKVNEKCTNKHCSFKKPSVPAAKSKSVSIPNELSTPTPPKAKRRSSRVVTYSLSELEDSKKES